MQNGDGRILRMIISERQAVVDAAVKSHKSHPNLPAINVLEVVLRGKAGLLFSVPNDVHDPVIGPRSGLGQLVAEAFDGGIYPRD